MNDLMQSLKKAGLFLLGGLMLVSGWYAGAQTTKEKAAKNKDKKAAAAGEKKDVKKADKKDRKKTTLEKKWPEKSSGSE